MKRRDVQHVFEPQSRREVVRPRLGRLRRRDGTRDLSPSPVLGVAWGATSQIQQDLIMYCQSADPSYISARIKKERKGERERRTDVPHPSYDPHPHAKPVNRVGEGKMGWTGGRGGEVGA